jgi:GntR family transcriptional regulator
MNLRTRSATVFDDRSPIYLQIAEQIKNDIVTGALAEDEQVMSTNQYAAFYRINPATAAKGFAQLVDEGVLYKKRGIGMFVSPNARELLRSGRRERFFADVVDPMVREAKAIGIPVSDVVRRIEEVEPKIPDNPTITPPTSVGDRSPVEQPDTSATSATSGTSGGDRSSGGQAGASGTSGGDRSSAEQSGASGGDRASGGEAGTPPTSGGEGAGDGRRRGMGRGDR